MLQTYKSKQAQDPKSTRVILRVFRINLGFDLPYFTATFLPTLNLNLTLLFFFFTLLLPIYLVFWNSFFGHAAAIIHHGFNN